MTQAELGEATGISRDKVAKIEIGERAVSTEELAEFSRVFQTTADELLRSGVSIRYRVNLDRPATKQAIAWFERCVDNSLFVRRLPGIYVRKG
jgi:transcriptional regulator with XRE-family HTH domain